MSAGKCSRCGGSIGWEDYDYDPEIWNRLSVYKNKNSVTAETMPNPEQIREILSHLETKEYSNWRMLPYAEAIWDRYWRKVDMEIYQIWEQIPDQIRPQIRWQIFQKTVDKIWSEIWEKARDHHLVTIVDTTGNGLAECRNQMYTQVRVHGYFAVVQFFDIPYSHPAFDLVRMGIITVTDAYHLIFGWNGMLLGAIK